MFRTEFIINPESKWCTERCADRKYQNVHARFLAKGITNAITSALIAKFSNKYEKPYSLLNNITDEKVVKPPQNPGRMKWRKLAF